MIGIERVLKFFSLLKKPPAVGKIKFWTKISRQMGWAFVRLIHNFNRQFKYDNLSSKILEFHICNSNDTTNKSSLVTIADLVGIEI